MMRWIALGMLPVLVAALGLSAPASAAQATTSPLLPDLIVPVTSWSLRDATIPPGTNELRFSTGIANVGTWALTVHRVLAADGKLEAVQEYQVDGATTSRSAGFFLFHPEHSHYHLEDFAAYELRAEASGLLVTGKKASFCLLDSRIYDSSLAVSGAVYVSCSQNPQGISLGYSDIYGSGLFGQSLSLVGVPDGIYRLVNTVNPIGVLLETNPANNTSEVRLRISTNRRGQRRAKVL